MHNRVVREESSPLPFPILCQMPPTCSLLAQRIDSRVDQMMENSLVEKSAA